LKNVELFVLVLGYGVRGGGSLGFRGVGGDGGGWAGNYTYIGAFANLHLLQQRS
jgi:hypothetical protein